MIRPTVQAVRYCPRQRTYFNELLTGHNVQQAEPATTLLALLGTAGAEPNGRPGPTAAPLPSLNSLPLSLPPLRGYARAALRPPRNYSVSSPCAASITYGLFYVGDSGLWSDLNREAYGGLAATAP